MELVYAHRDDIAVKVGDQVVLDTSTGDDGTRVKVAYFRPPHKPSSEGKITVEFPDGSHREFYVSVLGMIWINREDRP